MTARMHDSPMNVHAGSADFVPMLTVLPEAGGPFLWVVRRPEDGGVGPCLCDSMGWRDAHPLSEGLFYKFADWQWEFDSAVRDEGYCGDLGGDWTGSPFMRVGCNFHSGSRTKSVSHIAWCT